VHLTFGNRCGHVPLSPTLDISRPIPIGPGGYPRILAVAAERAEGFYAEPKVLPAIAVNPSSSQKRSERKEGVIRLLKAILKFLDLVSLTIAVRDAETGLRNITIPTLAKHADLELRRAERALRDLASAGFLFTVQQRIRSSEGGFRSVPAIKRVSPALFSALGLQVALKLERAKAQKRLARRRAETPPHPAPSPQPDCQQESFIFAVRNLETTLLQRTRTIPREKRDQPDRNMERQRRWNAIALELRDQHPDWPAQDIRAAADKAMLS